MASPLLTVCVQQYLIPWARIGVPVPESQNRAIGEQLWNYLEEQVKDLQ